MKQIFKENIDLFFLTVYFFSLPISHFAAVQSISLSLFILFFLIKYYRKIDFSAIKKYKKIIFVFASIFILAIISLFNTPDIKESLKEIKSEIIVSFFMLFIFFYYTLFIKVEKFKKIIFIIFTILFVHSMINIFIWYTHGGWPYRTGGLLDSGGGERFGIWASYMLSSGIALFFSKYKKIAFVFLVISITSIIANQTRATFVATIFILLTNFLFFTNSRKLKLSAISIVLVILGLFYWQSSNLSQRYNIQHIVKNVENIMKYPPSEFKKINMEYSTYTRLSMWKSAILYRLEDPFVPQEYGRFLFGKSIKINFKNQPQNIPVVVYAQTHNEFIGILYALGIFGLLLFLYLLYFQLKISYNVFKFAHITTYKVFAVFTLLGTVGFISSMMFGSFFGDSETKLFFPLYGIILGLHYKLHYEKNISN